MLRNSFPHKLKSIFRTDLKVAVFLSVYLLHSKDAGENCTHWNLYTFFEGSPFNKGDSTSTHINVAINVFFSQCMHGLLGQLGTIEYTLNNLDRIENRGRSPICFFSQCTHFYDKSGKIKY